MFSSLSGMSFETIQEHQFTSTGRRRIWPPINPFSRETFLVRATVRVELHGFVVLFCPSVWSPSDLARPPRGLRRNHSFLPFSPTLCRSSPPCFHFSLTPTCGSVVWLVFSLRRFPRSVSVWTLPVVSVYKYEVFGRRGRRVVNSSPLVFDGRTSPPLLCIFIFWHPLLLPVPIREMFACVQQHFVKPDANDNHSNFVFQMNLIWNKLTRMLQREEIPLHPVSVSACVSTRYTFTHVISWFICDPILAAR